MIVNSTAGLDRISIRQLPVICYIGIYKLERQNTQPIIIDLDVYLDTKQAARRQDLNFSLDYAAVSKELSFILQECRFGLLEHAADVLAAHLLTRYRHESSRSGIKAVDLTLHKPQALAGNAVPSIKVFRQIDDYQFDPHEGHGFRTVIDSCPQVDLSTIILAAQTELEMPRLVGGGSQAFLPLFGEVVIGRELIKAHQTCHRSDHSLLNLSNQSEQAIQLLCVHRKQPLLI